MKTTEIDGYKFIFPDWYLEEHQGKGENSFWMAPMTRPKAFEREERDLVKRHLNGNETVLELGGFVGVVACVINSLLREPERHVVVEVLDKYAELLRRNRNGNCAKFHVVSGQLVETSGRMWRDWYDRPKDVTIAELESKFSLHFDTLVMDIEGAEFDLIDQYPEFFENPSLSKVMVEWHRAKGYDRYDMKGEYSARLTKWGFQIIDTMGNVDFLTR